MKIKNLSLSFGVHEIFKNVNLDIPENEKVGIVGVNGAGKSTFFKLIMKRLEPDEGKIIIKEDYNIDLIPQVLEDEVSDLSIDVFSYLESGRPIKKLEADLQKTYEEIAKEQSENKQKLLFKKVDKIEQKLQFYRYLEAEEDLLKIVYGMKIEDTLLNSKLSDLSGGQKSKITFARLLYASPEIMFLDEPTNHLDEDTKAFVTNYLKEYKGSLYVISHDIEFLNEITTKILFIDKRTKKMELFDGNYNKFIKVHNEREKTLNKLIEIEAEKEKKLQTFIDKYSSSSGKRKRVVQDREKKLEKLKREKIEVIKTQKQVKVDMDIENESSVIPIKAKNLYFKYDKNYIIHNLSFEIERGEKFLIVGQNGVGKSTLLKLIVKNLEPNSGEINYGTKVKLAYYAQEHEILEKNKTIFENFNDVDITDKKLRSFLGRFLFFEDDIYKKVSTLSPGERARVALAKISLSKANLLILDEPTNHLDKDTQKIIAETFKDYKGTMLVVSHNPEFVDNLGIERVLLLPSGKIYFYDRKIVKKYEKINKNELKHL